MTLNKPVGMPQFKMGPQMTPEERSKHASTMEKLQIKPPQRPNLPDTAMVLPDVPSVEEPAITSAPTLGTKNRRTKSAAGQNSDKRLELIHWRIDADDLEALRNIAEAQFGTVNKLVRMIIAEWLEKNGKK